MSLTPAIIIHMTAAIGALVTGPVALWARKGREQRPRIHRAFGYAWVTLMIVAAVSALFIHESKFNFAGFSPIHLLVPFTLYALYRAFRALAQRNIVSHRKTMQGLYWGSCVVAGLFTLVPGRLIGNWFWGLFPSMAIVPQVLAGTPWWVWALLSGLIALGITQVRDRTAGLARILAMPVALGGFSIFGMVSAFGLHAGVLLPWLAAASIVIAIFLRMGDPAGVRYDATSRLFHIPGSWMPMAIILGIFLTRYVVNVAIAFHPEFKTQGDVAFMIAALYGALSGLFAGRAARLVRMALPQGRFASLLPAKAQLQRDPW